MDSDNNSISFWQQLKSSPTKKVGLILLVLALMLLLGLMVIISQKSTKKTTPANIPQANLNSQSKLSTQSPLPDPTKDWQLVSKKDFSLKIPPNAMTVSKENINGASNSAFLRVILDPKEATQTAVLIEVTQKNPPLQIIPDPPPAGIDLSKQAYILNLNNPNIKIITKPIDILIGGFKGYEFYLEGSEVKGYFGSSSFKKGKIRIIEFSTNDKHYVLISSLDSQIETILSTITIK